MGGLDQSQRAIIRRPRGSRTHVILLRLFQVGVLRKAYHCLILYLQMHFSSKLELVENVDSTGGGAKYSYLT